MSAWGVNTTACERRCSLGCVSHTDGCVPSEAARSNFVSAAGVCLMINSRTNKKLLKRLGGVGFTSMANFISGGAMLWFATIPMLCRNQKYNWW